MAEKIPFFEFFDSFVPPRELRLLLHDVCVTGGVLDRENRSMELELASGEIIPETAQALLRQLLMSHFELKQLRLTCRSYDKPGKSSSGGDVLLGREIKGKAVSM